MVGNEAHSFQSQENEFPTYVNKLPTLPSNKAYFRWAVFRFCSFCMEHMEHEQTTTSIRSGQGTNQFIGGNIPTIHMAKHMVRLRTSINWILEISH